MRTIATLLLLILLPALALGQTIANPSFESGSTGWATTSGGAGFWSFDNRSSTLLTGVNIPAATHGTRRAYYDDEGATWLATLGQPFTAPTPGPETAKITLNFDVWVTILGGSAQGSGAFDPTQSNTAEARVVLLETVDLGPPTGSVVVDHAMWQTTPGQGTTGPTRVSFDLAGYEGRQFELRLEICRGPNSPFIIAGIDNFFVEETPYLLVPRSTGIGSRYIAYNSTDWADLDQDGDFDIGVVYERSGVYGETKVFEQTAGGWAPVPVPASGVDNHSITFADLDNDNRPDLAIGNEVTVYAVHGSPGPDIGFGTVTGATHTGASGRPSMVAEDMFNTGHRELVAVYPSLGEFFQRVTPYSPFPGAPGTYVGDGRRCNGGATNELDRGSVVADFDLDRERDYFLTGSATLPGYTGPHAAMHYGTDYCDWDGNSFDGVHFSTAVVGDLDNDGDPDLVVCGDRDPSSGSSVVASLSIYFNQGGRNWSKVEFPNGDRTSDSGMALGDVDNDGDLDLAVATTLNAANNVLRIYTNDGNGNFSLPDVVAGGQFHSKSSLRFGDYDGDNDLDLLVAGRPNGGLGETVVYENVSAPPNQPPSAPTGLAVSGAVEGTLTFSWGSANDDHTPTPALMYGLRVGLSPGGSELFSAEADPITGRRYTASRGNVEGHLGWSLNLNLPAGTRVFWSVQAIDGAYIGGAFAEEQVINPAPTNAGNGTPLVLTALGEASPNPFNPATQLRFTLAETAPVKLVVYDAKGRHVATLLDEVQAAGEHRVMWHGLDAGGASVASGVYHYRLAAPGYDEARRMVLVR